MPPTSQHCSHTYDDVFHRFCHRRSRRRLPGVRLQGFLQGRFCFVFVSCATRDATRDDAHRDDVTSWTPPARAARENDASNAPCVGVREWYPVTRWTGERRNEFKKISIRSVFSSMRRGGRPVRGVGIHSATPMDARVRAPTRRTTE